MNDTQMRMDIQALAEQVRNLSQVGIVKEIDFSIAKVKIEFDTDFISDWLPWAEALAGNTHTWQPPKLGDQAIVLSSSGNIKRGVIVGYLNQSKYPQISTDGDLQKVLFANGTSVEVHETNNTMSIHCEGAINVDADVVNVVGDSGDVVVNGVSLVHHTHPQNAGNHFGGGADTSAPNQG